MINYNVRGFNEIRLRSDKGLTILVEPRWYLVATGGILYSFILGVRVTQRWHNEAARGTVISLSDLFVGQDCLDYRQVRALTTGKIILVITDVLKIRGKTPEILCRDRAESVVSEIRRYYLDIRDHVSRITRIKVATLWQLRKAFFSIFLFFL